MVDLSKLGTRNKMTEIISLKNERSTSYRVKKNSGVSVRRVDQILLWGLFQQSLKQKVLKM
ncbi:hypothetical protein COU54_00620 [Candidatus Pacearchaeota archaeon CG10_big_fil_rev_8_21_14_0_10_31_24]|nr:MAG: hypothetical protein COU54_00620 [Candidatus Pacearchaeota archaeon CG10_big_fil_rev_8_21_14_0_10_31_24]